MLQSWAQDNGFQIHGIYADIASGINFESRTEFFRLLEEILDYKVEYVIVAYKDHISRVGFSFFQKLFSRFGTEIIIISEIGNPKLDSEDVFNEIIALLHCYSMKIYSNRRTNQSIERLYLLFLVLRHEMVR